MKLLELWEKLPVILRWILLLPICFLIGLVIALFIRVTVLAGGCPLPVFDVVFPPLITVIDLFIFYHLAPSLKFKLLIFFITLRAILIPVIILAIYAQFHGFNTADSPNKDFSILAGEILTLIASVCLYKYLKHKNIKE